MIIEDIESGGKTKALYCWLNMRLDYEKMKSLLLISSISISVGSKLTNWKFRELLTLFWFKVN